MNSKMRSSVMGLILGQFSSPLPEAQKEPVAYLYNGVRLPGIEKVQAEAKLAGYAKGVIAYNADTPDGIAVYFTRSTPKRNGSQVSATAGYKMYWHQPEGTDEYWNAIKTVALGTISLNTADVIWTAQDILNEDGSIFLATSEPIPVYE